MVNQFNGPGGNELLCDLGCVWQLHLSMCKNHSFLALAGLLNLKFFQNVVMTVQKYGVLTLVLTGT